MPLDFLLNPKLLNPELSFQQNQFVTDGLRTGELGREVGALLLSSQVVGLRRVVGSNRGFDLLMKPNPTCFLGGGQLKCFF